MIGILGEIPNILNRRGASSSPCGTPFLMDLYSGAGTIFQQGGQDQPFLAGGLGAM